MRYGHRLRAEDAYWNIADPVWAYGLYFAARTSPAAMTLYDGAFTAESTYRVIEKYGITNLTFSVPPAVAGGVEAAD